MICIILYHLIYFLNKNKMIKKIIILLLVVTAMSSSVEWKTLSKKQIEKLNYYTYCYNSNQCEVPKELQRLIELNIQLIKQWKEPIFK